MAIATDTYNGPNKMVAIGLGSLLVLFGILGFFPAFVFDGIVEGGLLGIFGINTLHNWVHLLTGAVLLAAGLINGGAYARVTNLTLGWAYALITVLGFVVPDFMAGIISNEPVVLNPDAFLHLFFTIVLLGVAYTYKTEVRRPLPGART